MLTDTREGIEFGDPRPKVLSYHEAKGLTFDSIFMPRLDTGAFTEHLLRRQLPLMFVGVSRAMRWACLSTLAERMIPPVAAIVDGDVPEYMEVQHVGASSGTTNSNEDDEELPF